VGTEGESMDYVKREPVLCPTCDTTPVESRGVFSCRCPGKVWPLERPGTIHADEETTSVLKRKGFDLAPRGWYYVCGGDRIAIYLDGSWQLDSLEHEQPTIKDLKGYLLSLPDRRLPAA
jgi:hypothetical protein